MLDRHVDVLEVGTLGYAIPIIFDGDLIESFEDCGSVPFRDDSLLAQHRRVRLGGCDVLTPQAFVETDRRIDARHQLVGPAPEPAAPSALSRRLLCHCRRVAMREGGGQTM